MCYNEKQVKSEIFGLIDQDEVDKILSNYLKQKLKYASTLCADCNGIIHNSSFTIENGEIVCWLDSEEQHTCTDDEEYDTSGIDYEEAEYYRLRAEGCNV